MKKNSESIVVFAVDFVTINLAYFIYYWVRVRSGWVSFPIEPELWLPMLALYGYWLLWFLFFGLYRSWYAQSRIDEILILFRTTAIGVLVLFFLIFVDDTTTETRANSRLLIFVYWLLTFGTVAAGRLGVRAIQKRLIIAGVGARNTLIVGWSDKAFQLCDMVLKYPALGYKMVGFVRAAKKGEGPKVNQYKNLPVLGGVQEIPSLLDKHNVQEVLIGLDSTEHPQLLDVMKFCNGRDVGMKIVPDLYDIVSGQARLSSIYGFPLMELRPQLLMPWEAAMKRLVDAVVALAIILVGIPLWLIIVLAIKLDSRGPIFYKQERVGRNGDPFNILKFRSMFTDAEKKTGPVWADKNDPRITRLGRILRRFHLDEVPQFLNVLIGDMSLVGPRPERPYFVNRLSKEIPLYRHRHRVRPGITGWAQIKYKYDQSIEDVKSKLKYDLFYIENMSWRLDLKIMLNTLYVALTGKGRV
ncbi:MAG: sugar transferase [Ignavibacteriales bacterium]|nr:sugar transferase [Ignavibacteriales bacterium]